MIRQYFAHKRVVPPALREPCTDPQHTDRWGRVGTHSHNEAGSWAKYSAWWADDQDERTRKWLADGTIEEVDPSKWVVVQHRHSDRPFVMRRR